MGTSVIVSVIMTVYDTDFIMFKRAVDSVLNQNFQDFELIIIDDGTDNDDQNQFLSYCKKHQSKITYLFHANRGQSHSLNRAVCLCSGRYITFIDSDDEYKSNHLSSCLGEMTDADMIASTAQIIADKEEDYYVVDKNDSSKLVHIDDCFIQATFFGKKEIFEKMRFREMYGSDAIFFEEASRIFKVKKLNLRTYIYYRNNPKSTTARIKRKKI
jgi:glycosyltransferase involved in cell wall biosynthesis